MIDETLKHCPCCGGTAGIEFDDYIVEDAVDTEWVVQMKIKIQNARHNFGAMIWLVLNLRGIRGKELSIS